MREQIRRRDIRGSEETSKKEWYQRESENS
jgi:hypothetical protein